MKQGISTDQRRWRPTLRQTIGLVLAAMILTTAAVVTALSYFTTRSQLLDFSRELIAYNADVVREQVQGYLQPAKTAAALTLALADNGMVEVDDPHSVEKYFFDFLRVHPTVSMLNYGDERGSFLMVKRQPNGALWTKMISVDATGRRRVAWRHRDPGGPYEPPTAEVEDPDDQYDPRTRPWYQGARADRGLHWTGVYVFHTDKKPGVTAAVPRFSPDGLTGVLSVDIGLVDLSHFFRDRIRVGESGQAFLLDENARLIAFKQVDALTVQDSTPDATGKRLRTLVESPSPEVAALHGLPAFDDYFTRVFADGTAPTEHTLRYSASKQDYVATLMPIEIDNNRRWLAGVVALEDEFLAGAKKANVRALIAAVAFAAIALLIGVALARIIARSLRVLVDESARVRNLEITSPGGEQSRFREVDEVLRAFDGMKVGLRAFQKYVPIDLVRSLVAAQQDPALGGETRTLTILFSDIRDFTSISESLKPVDLAEKLGNYLGVVSGRINEHHGTVDKYIGDAVMAFWGAPREVADHAAEACNAALDLLEGIETLRRNCPDAPNFFTRVGIHTGEVVVGNFGSPERLNYTAMGDAVNLASRIEGVNKFFGTQVLISEDTWTLVADRFEARRIGVVGVKGRQRACVLYELLGRAGSVDPVRVEAARWYEEGLEHHLARRWDKAVTALERVLKLYPDDEAAALLLSQAQTLLTHPPKNDWSGVIILDRK